MHDVFFQNFLKAIVAIDPISLIPIFTAITTSLSLKETLKLSIVVFIITSFLLTFFCIYGNNFLVFMGISLGSFQVVGGLFLLIISFEMVLEKRVKRKKILLQIYQMIFQSIVLQFFHFNSFDSRTISNNFIRANIKKF